MPDRFRDTGVSTLDLIPSFYRGGDPEDLVSRLSLVFDDEFERWDDHLDELKYLRDPSRATDQQLAYLYAELGFESPEMATEERRRALYSDLSQHLSMKGNPNTVRDVIIALTGLGVDAIAFWSDPRYWTIGVSEFGIGSMIGIPYVPQSYGAWIIGETTYGDHPIGSPAINEHLIYTVQLNLSRPPTTGEQAAIAWAIRYFGRTVDHYETYYPLATNAYWIVGTSKVGSTTKVSAACWEFGVSLFGATSVICAPCDAPPNPVVPPNSPGTWVPFYQDGGGAFYPPPVTP